jgi:hypothetical protein
LDAAVDPNFDFPIAGDSKANPEVNNGSGDLKAKPIANPSYLSQVDCFRSDLLDRKITKLGNLRCSFHAKWPSFPITTSVAWSMLSQSYLPQVVGQVPRWQRS